MFNYSLNSAALIIYKFTRVVRNAFFCFLCLYSFTNIHFHITKFVIVKWQSVEKFEMLNWNWDMWTKPECVERVWGGAEQI